MFDQERRIILTIRGVSIGAAVIATALIATPIGAQQAPAVSIGKADIGGVVRSPSGPEAGVWVIAETTELPTKFAKIVVTSSCGPTRLRAR